MLLSSLLIAGRAGADKGSVILAEAQNDTFYLMQIESIDWQLNNARFDAAVESFVGEMLHVLLYQLHRCIVKFSFQNMRFQALQVHCAGSA